MTTTAPLAPYVPRDDLSKLTDEERGILDEAAAELKLPDDQRSFFVPFLRECEWDDEAAVRMYRKLQTEITRMGEPDLHKDILAHTDVGDDGVPTPCGVLLEDGRGECARDRQGNPVVLIYGSFECDAATAMRQLKFLNQRMQRYLHPTQISDVTYVFDMAPRQDRHKYGAKMDMDFLRFTSACPQNYKVYVCAAPERAAKAFQMVPSVMLPNIEVCADYSVLDGVIDPECRLPAWGGTFDFDLRRYREYLQQATA